MKVVIVGFDGQLGVDCQNVLGEQHTLICPTLADLNLLNGQQTTEFLQQHAPDVVINCAAYTAVDRCEEETELSWKINGEGPAVLAKSCKDLDCRLIHVSTDYVFDGKKTIPEPYLEGDPVNPLSQYGRSKLEGERAVQQNCDNFAILRTAWLYSANGPNFLKTMLRITLADPSAKRIVVNDQFGSLTWSYTLARQIALLLDDSIQGIVHTTSDGYSTWYEAACYFLELMRIEHNFVPCTTEEYPTPAHRPANSILANRVLEERKISVFVDWKEDLLRFTESNREKLLKELQQ